MHNISKPFSLNEAKIQAQILLKNIRSLDHSLAKSAIERIAKSQILFNESKPQQLKLKHMLTIIANEYGFSSWVNLKQYFTITGLTKFEPTGGGMLNQWFKNYKEAKQILITEGGYLLPYRNQFFISEAGYIEFIGLDPSSQDWSKIGCNWIEPDDLRAWQRLNALYLKVRRGRNHG